MDSVILVSDYMDIYHAFKDANAKMTDDQIIELMKVLALYSIAQAITTIKEDK